MTPRIVLIRHAERETIPPGEVGNEVAITAAGRTAARRLARRSDFQVNAIRSSPIRRCMETAAIIAEANGISSDAIKVSQDLGDPGYFIEDGELAFRAWQEEGREGVKRFLLRAEGSRPGFLELRSAANGLAGRIRKRLSVLDGREVWVTHDTVLGAFLAHLMAGRMTLADWPGYLDRLELGLRPDGDLQFDYVRHAWF